MKNSNVGCGSGEDWLKMENGMAKMGGEMSLLVLEEKITFGRKPHLLISTGSWLGWQCGVHVRISKFV